MQRRTLSHAQAAAFYDRMGAGQDSQAFYEDKATDRLIACADFPAAHRVVEFGCGTGRFAEKLLARHLPPTATYVGFDVSTKMTGLARARLESFGPRAEVRQTDGSPRFDLPDASVDRVVSNYVFDLLSDEDARAAFDESYRILRPGGLVAVASLTHGESPWSRVVTGGWNLLHRLSPVLVGGCRPIELADLYREEAWDLRHREVVTAFGLPSEVLVAAKR